MKILKVRDVKTPERGTSVAAGIDFFVPNDFEETIVEPRGDILIPSGIIANVPDGFMLMAADKSGIASSAAAKMKAGITPKDGSPITSIIVGAKIVDEDYTGEIHMHVINVGAYPVTIYPGMKLQQFILVPVLYDSVELVQTKDELLNGKNTERGGGAFGSTGVH